MWVRHVDVACVSVADDGSTQSLLRLAAAGGQGVQVPFGLQAMAALSLLLWASVVIVGRFMYAIDQALDVR